MSENVAEINLGSIQHNVRKIKAMVSPEVKCLAMIKANAYGHGLVPVAQALTEVDALGVARLASAIQLRQSGVTTRIVLMTGFGSQAALDQIIAHALNVVVHQQEQIDCIKSYPKKKSQKLTVWLKVNSGMNRLGFDMHAAERAYQSLTHCPLIEEPPILISHFSHADDHSEASQVITQKHYILMQQLRLRLNAPLSISHSAGMLTGYGLDTDWIRPGIMVYGVSPIPGYTGTAMGLQPAMTLRSHLIAKRTLNQGDTVGYGGTWSAPERMPMGIIGMGYGDGYSRYIPSGTPVCVDGVMCPLIGRVSMDMLAVDLRTHPEVNMGAQAVLWGPDLPVESIASQAGTIPYTLLTGVTPRVRYQYID